MRDSNPRGVNPTRFPNPQTNVRKSPPSFIYAPEAMRRTIADGEKRGQLRPKLRPGSRNPSRLREKRLGTCDASQVRATALEPRPLACKVVERTSLSVVLAWPGVTAASAIARLRVCCCSLLLQVSVRAGATSAESLPAPCFLGRQGACTGQRNVPPAFERELR
jgi:hypothetical protein